MKTSKTFDCIAMKRRIQQQVFEDTRNMSRAEFECYLRQRIASSRFSSFLKRSVTPAENR